MKYPYFEKQRIFEVIDKYTWKYPFKLEIKTKRHFAIARVLSQLKFETTEIRKSSVDSGLNENFYIIYLINAVDEKELDLFAQYKTYHEHRERLQFITHCIFFRILLILHPKLKILHVVTGGTLTLNLEEDCLLL